ncbi:hypothetical protein O3Q52_52330, partial [Streptomyces sp. ActVer]|uniref:hypothetical protein n=1 Tax=Streptomyces sp. ActVer TaxID=3014558 RepID=UPI0022B42DCE
MELVRTGCDVEGDEPLVVGPREQLLSGGLVEPLAGVGVVDLGGGGLGAPREVAGGELAVRGQPCVDGPVQVLLVRGRGDLLALEVVVLHVGFHGEPRVHQLGVIAEGEVPPP